ncbi:MAG: hypothetical protein HY903_14485 [Deltaproteobacteria bacterium]|nr:hypothetical protein [Deltaproteobacteria bacterium]
MNTKNPKEIVALVLLLGGAACMEAAVSPPEYGAYLTVVIAAQVQGVLQPGQPAANLGLVRPFVAGPQLEPDYISNQSPPFCMGFTFGAGRPPNVVNADAGTISIAGLHALDFMDMTAGPTPGPQTPMPDPVVCNRAEAGSTLPYVCNIPSVVLEVAPPGTTWIDNHTAASFRISGGDDVGAFHETDVGPPPPAVPASTFALNQIDPRAVTAAWEPVDAAMVMIELIAQLQDGSAGAQVLCLEPAPTGLKEIPAPALALLPEPSNSNPLFIETHLVALSLRQGSLGWGGYMVGLGRGAVGMSCRIPSGNCPPS